MPAAYQNNFFEPDTPPASSLCMLPSAHPLFPLVARSCLGYNKVVGNLQAAKSPWSCFSVGFWTCVDGVNELLSLTSALSGNRFNAQLEASQAQCAAMCPQVTSHTSRMFFMYICDHELACTLISSIHVVCQVHHQLQKTQGRRDWCFHHNESIYMVGPPGHRIVKGRDFIGRRVNIVSPQMAMLVQHEPYELVVQELCLTSSLGLHGLPSARLPLPDVLRCCKREYFGLGASMDYPLPVLLILL